MLEILELLTRRFVTYVKDLPDHLSIDSLLYADDAKLIALPP